MAASVSFSKQKCMPVFGEVHCSLHLSPSSRGARPCSCVSLCDN